MSLSTNQAVTVDSPAVPLATALEPANRPSPAVGLEGRAPEPSDAVLMQRASAGDSDAFAVIYDRHAPAALGLARHMVRNPEAAEDVVQEAFIRLWRSRTYRPAKGSVRTFLLRIVHNAAVDSLRRERSNGAGRHVDAALADLVAVDDQTNAGAERNEAAERVRAALLTLPESQQHPIVLAYFGGLTQVEIALAAGVPVGTVKSRMRVGLEKLRREIDAAFCV